MYHKIIYVKTKDIVVQLQNMNIQFAKKGFIVILKVTPLL